MSKIFKLLGNVNKIFKYLKIFTSVSNGLRIATIAIEVTIKELKESKPDFKYLNVLESVESFIKTAKETVDAFIAIFGIAAEGEKTDDPIEFSDELAKIESDIKKELK